jgi:uncharacterized protein (TIGR03435 family)
MRIAGIFIASALFAQSSEFEAASIKPANPGNGIDITISPGGRLTVTGLTLHQLIEQAYGIEKYQITGGPVWISQDGYDILAAPPVSSRVPTRKEVMQMLQALLADRFHLKLHRESKESTVYALVVSSKGAKLQPTKGPNERPLVGNGYNLDHDSPDVTYYISGQNVSMPLLAAKLASFVRHPVTDETGLSGSFDFKFEYAGGNDNDFLFTAIQKELGLKLDSRKGSIEILAIDHAEKPSAN